MRDTVEQWLEQARARVNSEGIHAADLDELAQAMQCGRTKSRQRLLYLHADSPNIKSSVISMALHEPVPGDTLELTATPDWPYRAVHDAIIDGWRVIHFPQQTAPFDDREIDVLGYEFILEKWEEYCE